jgi:hypothetical protein
MKTTHVMLHNAHNIPGKSAKVKQNVQFSVRQQLVTRNKNQIAGMIQPDKPHPLPTRFAKKPPPHPSRFAVQHGALPHPEKNVNRGISLDLKPKDLCPIYTADNYPHYAHNKENG